MSETNKRELSESKAKAPAKRQGGNNKHGRGLPSVEYKIKANEDKELVKQLLSETLVEFKKPRAKSDEELAERFNEYFEKCSRTGQVPTVEEMCLSTGIPYGTLWNWQAGIKRGFSDSTGEIVKKAKDFLKTFDAKLVVAGKLNFLTYCFRAKNYYGMTDKQEITVAPAQMERLESAEELAKAAGMLPSNYVSDDDK